MENGKMYCKHCGEIIDADSIVCPKCGKQVGEIKKAQPKVITNNASSSSSSITPQGKRPPKKTLPPNNEKPLIITLIVILFVNIIRPVIIEDYIDGFNFVMAILVTYEVFKYCPRAIYRIKVKLLKMLTQKDNIKEIDNKSKKAADIIVKLMVFVVSCLCTITLGSFLGNVFQWFESEPENNEPAYETAVERNYQSDEVDIDSVMSDIDSATKGNTNTNTNTNTDTKQKTRSTLDSLSSKTEETYKIGDEMYVTTNRGDYILKIDGVSESDYRNPYVDTQADRVIIIDYTVGNVNYEGSIDGKLSVSNYNFDKYDAYGYSLEDYSVSSESVNDISPGHLGTGKLAIALNNDTNYIELEYKDNMFLGTIGTFEVTW